MQASSFDDGENAMNLRNVLAVLEPVSENPKGEGLGLGHRFVPSHSVRENARKFCYFSDPPTVLFPLDLDVELAHSEILISLPHSR